MEYVEPFPDAEQINTIDWRGSHGLILSLYLGRTYYKVGK
ncbi:hypothetical protein J5TS2_24190 [Brevibacillus halotolerans]|nr:hypothetical protein J5TS2_24190 [Brevibacillus halotolerans]